MTGWQFWRKAGLDLLFPPRCLLCDTALRQEAKALCENCLLHVEFLRSPLCRCCGAKVAGGPERVHFCGSCLRHPPPYRKAMAIIRYDQPAAVLLHRLKYNKDTSVLPGLARIITAAGKPDFPHPDLIVPVPLHRRRLQERGLNQSVFLARLFFPGRLPDIHTDLLRRVRDTPAQTTLDGSARRKNLRSAFLVSDNHRLQGRSVCLVDDVFTTGTTVAECSRALVLAGAEEVLVLTLARVIPAL
ncbi:MAG: ComF family protein [Desulfoprunum sp.]|nr:ComF family protein [Desulfoprunum sp.]